MSQQGKPKDLLANTTPLHNAEPGLMYDLIAFGINGALFWFLSLIVMICWNFVIPKVFGLPTLSYIEAAVLYALVQILKLVPNNTTRQAHRRRNIPQPGAMRHNKHNPT